MMVRRTEPKLFKQYLLKSVLLVAGVIAGGLGTAAQAANYFVSASTSSFNGAAIKPGDTITLAAGNRGPLRIYNVKGTATDPIVIRNDRNGTGPTIITRTSGSSGGFVFNVVDSVHFRIDGEGGWSGRPSGAYCGAPAGRTGCGIKVTGTGGTAPTALLKISGTSTRFDVRGVEVDGAWPRLYKAGICVSQNDHLIDKSDYPGLWREDIAYTRNFFHNCKGPGMYIGPNWIDPSTGKPSDDIELRNVEISHNLIENTGAEAIQIKSAWQGENPIHHNVTRSVGTSGKPGISCYESTCLIFNNLVEWSGTSGIQHYIHHLLQSYAPGPMVSDIYNNVVINSGVTSAKAGHGITTASNKTTPARTAIRTTVRSNTVADAKGNGINNNSRASGVIRDNIVAGAAGTAITNAGKKFTLTNNRTGTISSMAFVDPTRHDFRLRDVSPARNAGSTSGFPTVDYADVARPQEGVPDQGGFEYER